MKTDRSTIETSHIGKNVMVMEYCVIRPDVKIGNNVVIHPRVMGFPARSVNYLAPVNKT